jgi:hypothetical protein
LPSACANGSRAAISSPVLKNQAPSGPNIGVLNE